MTRPQNTSPHESHPELAALADGSLTGARRERLEAEVARSPELAAALEQQRRAIRAVRAIDVRAPDGLRARVQDARTTAAGKGRVGGARGSAGRLGGGERSAGRAARLLAGRRSDGETGRLAGGRTRRLGFGIALAGATAAVAVVVALSLPGGAGGPSVVEAAELGTQPATQPAPGPAGPKLLAAKADGLPFPDWAEKFGWKAVGERRDEIDGRDAVTVFYAKEGNRIAYTIVSGDALDPPPSSAAALREGTRLRYVRGADGRLIVTWKRNGRTCILTGTDVPAKKMLDLAAWRGLGNVPF